MKRSELVIGRIYTVAGQGEMRLAKLDHDRMPEMVAHGGGTYWSSPEQIVCEASPMDLIARDAEARARGVACEDEECWCRPFVVRA